MTPNEMKLKRQAVILKIAEDMGWTAVVELNGYDFEAYFTAEGACEQFVEGKLSQAEQILDNLGGPELYPAVEEYEIVEEYDLSTKADNELTEEIVEKYDPYLPDEPVAGEDSQPEEDRIARAASLPTLAAGEAEVIDISEALCEKCSLSEAEDCLEGPSAPCDAMHEDVHDHDEHRGPLYLNPKELHQAMQIQDQDCGGIPRPNQHKEARMSVKFSSGAYIAPEGHKIEARKPGEATRQYGRGVNEDVKLGLSAEGWRFFAVENKTKETLLAGGTITVKSGRFVAAKGHRIIARKGTMYFEALSLSTSYQKSGWALSATQ